jgi:hypothetical protein
MSYPPNLTEYEKTVWKWAMDCPIPECESYFGKILESTTAHGCPKILTHEGNVVNKTLDLHHDIAKVVLDLLGSKGFVIDRHIEAYSQKCIVCDCPVTITDECCQDGIDEEVTPGWGSRHDGEAFNITICDNCIENIKNSEKSPN